MPKNRIVCVSISFIVLLNALKFIRTGFKNKLPNFYMKYKQVTVRHGLDKGTYADYF